MAQGLSHFWNEWGIQVLVLLSFTLQVMLLAFAETRRRKSSAPLRLLLWLMYQLADSTAIYTLGHLSVAFWAPFLLVRLGGPGTITAYALEDNRLWLRHLLTLSMQVLGAAFVIYKYIIGRRTLLLLAAILVFVVGVLRYGERTWALWCGNMSSIRSTLKYPKGKLNTIVVIGKNCGGHIQDKMIKKKVLVTRNFSWELTHCSTSARFGLSMQQNVYPSLIRLARGGTVARTCPGYLRWSCL